MTTHTKNETKSCGCVFLCTLNSCFTFILRHCGYRRRLLKNRLVGAVKGVYVQIPYVRYFDMRIFSMIGAATHQAKAVRTMVSLVIP